MCVSALGINVRLCFGFTAANAAAAEAANIAATAQRAHIISEYTVVHCVHAVSDYTVVHCVHASSSLTEYTVVGCVQQCPKQVYCTMYTRQLVPVGTILL